MIMIGLVANLLFLYSFQDKHLQVLMSNINSLDRKTDTMMFVKLEDVC